MSREAPSTLSVTFFGGRAHFQPAGPLNVGLLLSPLPSLSCSRAFAIRSDNIMQIPAPVSSQGGFEGSQIKIDLTHINVSNGCVDGGVGVCPNTLIYSTRGKM